MSIPLNTGPFHVGCVDILTKAEDIPKDFHPRNLAKLKLGLLVRLYYPSTQPEVHNNQVKWVPEPYQKMNGYALAKQANIRLPFFGWMAYSYIKNIYVHAFYNSQLIAQEDWASKQTDCFKQKNKLPVVVFSHGLKGNRSIYSSFCAQLASEGYIVAATEHRDASCTSSFVYDDTNQVVEIPYYVLKEEGSEALKIRNIQLKQRVKEVLETVTLLSNLNEQPSCINNLLPSQVDVGMFKDRLDMDSIIMMGHSFGGATATKSLKEDNCLKCGVGLDVWFEPLEDEFYHFDESNEKSNFLITTEYFNWKKNLAMYQKYENSMKNKTYVEQVTLKGAVHYDQCDIPAIVPTFLKSYFNKQFEQRIDFNHAIEIQRSLISKYCQKFHQEPKKPVNMLAEELSEEFIIGSNIVLNDKEEESA